MDRLWRYVNRKAFGDEGLTIAGDDCQLLLYDLTGPLPVSRPSSRAPNSRNANGPSPSYALSPPATPATNRTPSPAEAVDIFPSKAWTADAEINNLVFTENGHRIGCVSGQKLSVLQL